MSNEKNPLEAPLRVVGGQLLEARKAAAMAGPGASHQMEVVATVNEVLYINDSRSTFLDATLSSLGSLDRKAVWIAGAWSDDLADGYAQELLAERVSAIVLFGMTADEQGFTDGGNVFLADDVRMAVFLARELAKAGELVLFSPACPSGCGFANYEERGAEYRRAVRDLQA
jgi:UDP-N-acetylmuramoylalanine--D-glutamate ligase